MSNDDRPKYRGFIAYIGLIVLIIGAILFFVSRPTNTTTTTNTSTESAMLNKKTYSSPPEMAIDPAKKYLATFTTSKGEFTVELFANETPNTVNNFVFLTHEGFYDGTVFHRIVKDFMIQGGDPQGDGTGGPGYKFPDEKVTRDYKRGVVAMANSGPNTNGSQFFVMHKDYDLPKDYVIFGQVTSGIETIDKIAEVPTVNNGQGEQSKPSETVMVKSVIISEQ